MNQQILYCERETVKLNVILTALSAKNRRKADRRY